MTDARMKALEAVAEAARATVREVGGTDGLFEALRNLRALDALPAATPGDVVEAPDIRAVCLQAIDAKLASVPTPRSYEMAHYCMGLEDASLAIQAKITSCLPLAKEAGDAG